VERKVHTGRREGNVMGEKRWPKKELEERERPVIEV